MSKDCADTLKSYTISCAGARVPPAGRAPGLYLGRTDVAGYLGSPAAQKGPASEVP
jgi:hypothetical protein